MNNRDNPTPKSPDDGNRGGMNGGQTLLIIALAALITFAVVGFMRGQMRQGGSREVSYSHFLKMVDQGEVNSVVIGNTQIQIEAKPGTGGYTEAVRFYTVRMDEDGDLIIDYDGKWMTLNGEVVAVYTMTNEWATDTDYSMMYYIPARINGEDANIIIDYSSQNELGAVLGYEKIYETNVDSKMIPFVEGDKIDLVCDHYDNKGNFEDRYLMGSTITVGSDLKLELGDATLSNTDLLYGYRLVDIYNAERFTPMVEY